jgi:predicted nucleic acid-binding protein
MQNPRKPEKVPASVAAAAAVSVDLRETHARNAAAAIVVPDDFGRFPRVGSLPLPVVVDANRLYHDMRPACRNGRRTVLVSAANGGAIRLFAARHVVEEFHEHAEEWADKAGVDRGVFMDRWRSEYAPLLRVFDAPAGLLTPAEAGRVELLESGPPEFRDADDVPSAVLALVLGAFFLSRDKKPVKAVYGHDVDMAEREAWLEVLRAGGDAPVLRRMQRSDEQVAAAAGQLAFLGAGKVWRASPAAALLTFGALYWAWRRAPAGFRGAVADVATVWAVHWTRASQLAQVAGARFAAASVPTPEWGGLAGAVGGAAALERATLFVLARAGGPLSAVEAAERVRELGVAASEARVRAVLRAAAVEVSRGRFQLGGPAAALLV